MKLPVSFEETAYFKNEYRGDLIITTGVLYYFPHTRVSAARFNNDVLGGREKAGMVGLAGALLPLAGAAPTLYALANNSVKFARFLNRMFRPGMNSPLIDNLRIRLSGQSNNSIQQFLDRNIVLMRMNDLEFGDDSIPKPMRFTAEDMKNARLGLKFTFETEYDDHDFRVNLFHLRKLKDALAKGGFIK